MPPRWSRVPDRKDPEYRRLDDRMTLAVHIALFTATNSSIWFFHLLGNASEVGLPWPIWLTLPWLGLLGLHIIYIAAIADYSS